MSVVRRALGAAGWPIHTALATLLLPRAVFLGEALFDRDIHLYWHPWALAFSRTLSQGLLPLWDVSSGFGQPLLGNPSAQVLYPTTWLQLLWEPWIVYTIFAVIHLVFSASGFTRLARALGLGPGPAVVAGAVWMLGGPMASLVNLWHHFAGAAWMPWVVLGVHRLTRRPGAANLLVFGACLGLQVLAGSADMVLLTAGLSCAWLVALYRPRSRRHLGRAATALLVGVVLAAALSAAQWLPAADLASRGLRRVQPSDQAGHWAVSPAGLVRMLLPLDASGRLAWTRTAQNTLFDSERPPFLGSLYVGGVAFMLVAAGLASRRHRRLAVSLALLATGAVLIALGPHAPFYELAARFVPGVSHVRYPSKLMIPFGFATALLAGVGAAAVRRGRSTGIAAGAGLAVAVVLAASAALLGPALRTAVAWGLLADRAGVEGDALRWALRLSAHAALALLATALLVAAGRRAPGTAPARPLGLLAACLVADLLLAHHDLHSTAPPALLAQRPPVLSAIDSSDGARSYVYDYSIIAGSSLVHLRRNLPYEVSQPPAGVDPRPYAAFAMRVYPVPPVAGSWGAYGSYDLDALGLQLLHIWGLNLSLRYAESTPDHRRLLQLGAVHTVVALHERGFEDLVPGATFPSLFPERIRTYTVPDARPRAYAVGEARALSDRESLRAIFEPSFEPDREVILSGEGASTAAAAAAGGKGSVRILQLAADRERLEVELDAPGIVVSVDAWDPGWRVRVDGQQAPLLRANVAFRGVAVPAGRHVIEMTYRPTPVAIGVLLSALGLLALGGGCAWLWARRSR